MIHISKRSVHVLNTFVLFNIFAEGTASFLHVCEFILILKEEFAALVTYGNCYIGYHILVVSPWPLRTELRVIYNIDFFIAHTLENSLINFNRFVLIWGHLGFQPFKHTLSEQIILKIVSLLE